MTFTLNRKVVGLLILAAVYGVVSLIGVLTAIYGLVAFLISVFIILGLGIATIIVLASFAWYMEFIQPDNYRY